MNPTGVCGLCRQPRELRRSHLMPKALYRMAREPQRQNPNPVVITERGAVKTSEQAWTHFLCGECEQRFSHGGEGFALRQCAISETSFPLRDRILGARVVAKDPRYQLREVGLTLGSDVDKFLYFAASIFWRASARRWPFLSTSVRTTLGPYEEMFRQYLLGKRTFPSEARLFVFVWVDNQLFRATVPPFEKRTLGERRHKFCIPGVMFSLFVGRQVPEKLDMEALNGSAGARMWLSKFSDDALSGATARMMMNGKRQALAR